MTATGLLEGRTAIVTGAGGGIGRGIAQALAAEGARVVIAARRASTGNETLAAIQAEGGSAIVVETDVAQRPAVEAAIAAALASFGGLDIVVHNAASGHSSRPTKGEDITDRDWDEQSAIALDAAFYLARAAFAHLRDSGRGRFIILSSAQALHGGSMNPIYASVKSAQRGMAKALAARSRHRHGQCRCQCHLPRLCGSLVRRGEQKSRVSRSGDGVLSVPDDGQLLSH